MRRGSRAREDAEGLRACAAPARPASTPLCRAGEAVPPRCPCSARAPPWMPLSTTSPPTRSTRPALAHLPMDLQRGVWTARWRPCWPRCAARLRRMGMRRMTLGARGGGPFRGRCEDRWREESQVGEERKEEEDDVGSICQQVERRERVRVFWTIRQYRGLQVDPRALNTYKMAHLKQRMNSNSISPNR